MNEKLLFEQPALYLMPFGEEEIMTTSSNKPGVVLPDDEF